MCQRHGIQSGIEAQAATIRQLQLDLDRARGFYLGGSRRHPQVHGSVKFHRKKQRLRQGRKQPLLLQIMPPSVDLLPRHIMPLRNLRHCRAAHADRLNDLELLLVSPPSPTLQPKNIATHQQPRIRHVVNDVVMHVP